MIAKKKKKAVKKVATKKETPIEDKIKLSFKQELFCQAWIDFKGNGTVAALLAFDIKGKEILEKDPPKPKKKKGRIINKEEIEIYWDKKSKVKNTASVMSLEYLRKPHILKRIDQLLDERGFTDETVKREHWRLITGDLIKDEVKRASIADYYKLKGRFADKLKLEGDIIVKWKNK